MNLLYIASSHLQRGSAGVRSSLMGPTSLGVSALPICLPDLCLSSTGCFLCLECQLDSLEAFVG